MNACLVCQKPTPTLFLCKACGRSYDKMIEQDPTTANIIRWAANRARKFKGKNR